MTATAPAGLVVPTDPPRDDLSDVVGRSPFDRPRYALCPGVTVVLRVRNEARSLPRSLPPLLRAADAVLLVDNRSTDGTAQTSQEVAARAGLADRLRVLHYPYPVSRCGPEHLATPPDSPHSLAYFNNWALSHVQTHYAVKWDGDMVLTADGENALSMFSWQVGDQDVLFRLPRHPLYVESDQVAYLDLGLHNVEHFGHPARAPYSYVKAFEWETLYHPERVSHYNLAAGSCVELKYLDQDEFDHWADPDAFATLARTRRKRREYAVFQALRAGAWDALQNLHRIEAPPGRHVIDHVVQEWLPHRPRPLVSDLELGARR